MISSGYIKQDGARQMRITKGQLRRIIKEELATSTHKRTISEMHEPGHRSPISLYKKAAHEVENSYAPDYDELSYKLDYLEQEFLGASMGDMTALSALQSRYARDLFLRIADALGYPQVDLDQDVLVPSRLVNATLAELRASLPPQEDF